MNNNQKLGIKVFYYYLSRKTILGVLVLIISIIVASSKAIIVLKLKDLMSLNGAALGFNYLVNSLFVVSAVLILIGVIASWLKYINCEYDLGENALNIRRGLLNKKEISIPYRQIQNINIEQDFNHKLLGLCSLVILTDGSHEGGIQDRAESTFDIIDYKIAIGIRDFILQRTNISPSSNI